MEREGKVRGRKRVYLVEKMKMERGKDRRIIDKSMKFVLSSLNH